MNFSRTLFLFGAILIGIFGIAIGDTYYVDHVEHISGDTYRVHFRAGEARKTLDVDGAYNNYERKLVDIDGDEYYADN